MITHLLNDPRKTLQVRRWLAAILVAVVAGVPIGSWMAIDLLNANKSNLNLTQKKWEGMGELKELTFNESTQLRFAGKARKMRFIKLTSPLKPRAPGYSLHIPQNLVTKLNHADFWSFSLYSQTGTLLFVDNKWPTVQMTPKYLVTNDNGDVIVNISNSLNHEAYYTLPLPNQPFQIVWRLYGSTDITIDQLQLSLKVLDDDKLTKNRIKGNLS